MLNLQKVITFIIAEKKVSENGFRKYLYISMVQRSYGYESFRFKNVLFWATPGGTSGYKWRNISLEI